MIKNAFAYVTRKSLKSIIIMLVILAMSTLSLISLSIKDATDRASKETFANITNSFSMEINRQVNPGTPRRETLETYTSRLRQLEDITNNFKGVDKSFAIQAGREVRVMVVPEQISDADMVLLARDISKQIEAELEYPGQIKVNVIRESRVIDYAK